MSNIHSRGTPADALVIFGVSGDLAHKMIFPALYAMAKRASSTYRWSVSPLRIGAWRNCAITRRIASSMPAR